MKKRIILIVSVAMLFSILSFTNVYAASGWSKQWNEAGYIYAAFAESKSTSAKKETVVPGTKVEHDGVKTTTKVNEFKFSVSADSTLGQKYATRFSEIYPRLNTGKKISVKMGSTSYTLDRKTKPGKYQIVVETPGYAINEKVQRWSESQVRSNPGGTCVYSKSTAYAPAKNKSAYKLVKTN